MPTATDTRIADEIVSDSSMLATFARDLEERITNPPASLSGRTLLRLVIVQHEAVRLMSEALDEADAELRNDDVAW